MFQTQRRVTFHLPDGSQESCSDSGLGDPEPSSTASTTQPLPLSFPQEEYYEQTSPNSRTEGDGNSDPESSEYWNLLCSDSRQICYFMFFVLIVFLWLLRLTFHNIIYKGPSVFFDTKNIYRDYSCDCHSNNTALQTLNKRPFVCQITSNKLVTLIWFAIHAVFVRSFFRHVGQKFCCPIRQPSRRVALLRGK